MSDQTSTSLNLALAKLLRPLVKLLIKQGFTYASFSEVVRRLFVDVAAEEFKLPGKKQSASRIAILTGINRKDVAKILNAPEEVELGPFKEGNRPSRIIQGWLRDNDFINESGAPKPLHFEGGEHSFSELVRRYGGDVPPRAVFDELIRVGAITQNLQQKILLCSSAYVPQTGLDEKFRIMGRASSDLFSTLEHNLEHEPYMAHLQRTVAYSNIPLESLAQVRLRSKEEGEQFLLQVNQWLSQQDKDVNPETQGSGKARAGIGIYYFENILEEDA